MSHTHKYGKMLTTVGFRRSIRRCALHSSFSFSECFKCSSEKVGDKQMMMPAKNSSNRAEAPTLAACQDPRELCKDLGGWGHLWEAATGKPRPDSVGNCPGSAGR